MEAMDCLRIAALTVIGCISTGCTSGQQASVPQADFEVPACARYFESRIWRFDTGPQLWSLSLIPSSCTRSLNGHNTSTGLIIDSIIRDESSSPHWKEANNTHGMRDQIICHLDKYPTKTEWNSEPGRPDVGYASTYDQDCNPER
jgi:hypothetical protein